MEEIGHKFRVSNVEGKGAGWIATKNIQRGELIWTESPILNPMGHFAFLGAINKAVNDLSKKNQKLFESLYDPEDGGGRSYEECEDLEHQCYWLGNICDR